MTYLPKKKKAPAKPKRGTKMIAPGDVGVIYARYSSHNQRDVSIEQQEEAARSLANDLQIPIISTYADRAISGRTDKRTGFQKMMNDAAKGKFKYVIAWKSNRLGRNMLEALINETRLADMGVRVLYTEEDFDDSAAGRFAARSMMNVNQFYSESMAEDIKRGLDDNAKKCKVNGALSLGFKKGEDGRYAIDEPNAKIVEEAFVRVAAMESFVDIYNDFNARGLKTSTGSTWNKSSLSRILRNKRYRGVYIWGDTETEGGVPRIVSDELFYKVQEVLNMKQSARGRHTPNGDYLLTGKLFCGKCKSPMTGISGTSKTGDSHYYYVCSKKRNEHSCDKVNIRRDAIEEAVATAIRDYALQPDVIDWIADSAVEYNRKKEEANDILVLKDELKQTQAAIKNILSAIEQGIITDSTKGRLIELEAKQSQLHAKISAAQADIVIVSKETLVEGLKMFKDGDVNDKSYKAKLFDTFLVAVYVYDDTLRIVFSFSGNKNTVDVPFVSSVVDDIQNIDRVEGSFKVSKAPPAAMCRSKLGTISWS